MFVSKYCSSSITITKYVWIISVTFLIFLEDGITIGAKVTTTAVHDPQHDRVINQYNMYDATSGLF